MCVSVCVCCLVVSRLAPFVPLRVCRLFAFDSARRSRVGMCDRLALSRDRVSVRACFACVDDARAHVVVRPVVHHRPEHPAVVAREVHAAPAPEPVAELRTQAYAVSTPRAGRPTPNGGDAEAGTAVAFGRCGVPREYPRVPSSTLEYPGLQRHLTKPNYPGVRRARRAPRLWRTP